MKKSLLLFSVICLLGVQSYSQEKLDPQKLVETRVQALSESLELSGSQIGAVEAIVTSTANVLAPNIRETSILVQQITQAFQEELSSMRSVLTPEQLKAYQRDQMAKINALKEIFGVDVANQQERENSQQQNAVIKK